MVTGDWELTESRLPIAAKIVKAMREQFHEGDYDRLVFTGDMFREYTAGTELFARRAIEGFAGDVTQPNIMVVGNHDREVMADRLTALFGETMAYDAPTVTSLDGTPIGILPAPDRAAFGSGRGAEGKRARDSALSDALEAALVSLETQIGGERLGEAMLLFHATVDEAVFGSQKQAAGLTWQIPAARLQRWGLAIGGHIHQPQKIGENIYYTGGIAPWDFSDKAERFRVLVVDTKTLEVESKSLPTVLLPIEIVLGEYQGQTAFIAADDKGFNLTDGSGNFLFIRSLEACLRYPSVGAKPDDRINLKIRARLPQSELDLIPSAEEIKKNIRFNLETLTICREPTAMHKIRISEDAHKFELPEMIDEYVKATEGEFDAEVVDRAKQLLDDIADQYLPGEGNFGFSPKRLWIKNFRQWGDVELDLEGLAGGIAITGDNALGKSNLLEAILFALFKRSPSSSDLEEELRHGEAGGSVELWFSADGSDYLVRRSLERTGSGVSCKSEFFIINQYSGDKTPVCEKANEIDKRIPELVGSYDFVISTFIGTQSEIDRLVDATPTQWHKLLLEALALERFEPLRKISSDRKARAQEEVEKIETRIDELQQQITVDAAEMGDLGEEEEIKEQIVSATDTMKTWEKEIEKLQRRKERLIEQKAEMESKASARMELLKKRSKLQDRIDEISIEDIGEKPDAPDVTDLALEEHKELLKKMEQQREKLSIDIEKLGARLARVDAELEAAAREEKRLRGKHDEVVDKKRKLCDKNKELTAPCDPELRPECEAWKEYTRGDHIERLEREAEKLAAEITQARARQHDENGTQLGIELKDKKSRFEKLTRDIKAKADFIGDQENKKKALEIWQSKKRLADSRENLLEEAGEELLGVERQIGDLGGARSRLVEINEERNEVVNVITSKRVEIKDKAECRDLLQRKLSQIESFRRGIEDKKRRQKELEGEKAGKTAEARAWGLLAQAFHNTGIPYLFMERMISSFQTEANELLSPTDLSVEIETVTATKKGEARDRVSVHFYDARGRHPLGSASGYQRAALGMALRASMAAVGSRFWGAVPEIYVQDEGWERFHSSRRDIARELIDSLAGRFNRFFYITHIDQLAQTADVHLQVVGEGGASRLIGLGTEEERVESKAS